MQFVVIAHDDTVSGLEKRLSAREDHIRLGNKLQSEGKHLVGAAILDDNNNMRGSVLIVDFPSRKELDAWLAAEPYVTSKTWDKIEIYPCKIGPSFSKLFDKQ